MANKKIYAIASITIIILFLSFSMVSAGWFGDFWNKITGNAIALPTNLSEDWSNICNNGKNYEITSDNRIYVDNIRKPTSYILPKGSIKLGIRNTDTGESNYNLSYAFTTNEPSKILIRGNQAKDIIPNYNNYTIFIDINSPELASCSNIKQPMRVMIGDAFLGEDIAFIYPKDIVPVQVLNPNQDWANISVGQMMSQYDFIRVTDRVHLLQERLFAHDALDGDVLLMGLMPAWCGGAGQPMGFGVGCLIQPNNQPHWGIVFHEMGHVTENFLGETVDGIGRAYTNNRKYFSEIDKESIGGFMYAEGIATLSALYSKYNIINNPSYNFSQEIISGINNQFNTDHSNYLNDLTNYELNGSDFSRINANILDGIFISLAENTNLNRFGWEVYPRFFRIYQNPLPSFINSTLTELQGHTYFIAGLSASMGADLRFLFKDKWNFPINDTYFNEIYPALNSLISYPSLDLLQPSINGLNVEQNGVTFATCNDLDLSWCKTTNPSSDGTGPFEFKWDDGKVSCSWFPTQHIYSNSGNYTIKVRVKNTCGFISERQNQITLTKSKYILTCQKSSKYYKSWHTAPCSSYACGKDKYLGCEKRWLGRYYYREVCQSLTNYNTACSETSTCGSDKEIKRTTCA